MPYTLNVANISATCARGVVDALDLPVHPLSNACLVAHPVSTPHPYSPCCPGTVVLAHLPQCLVFIWFPSVSKFTMKRSMHAQCCRCTGLGCAPLSKQQCRAPSFNPSPHACAPALGQSCLQHLLFCPKAHHETCCQSTARILRAKLLLCLLPLLELADNGCIAVQQDQLVWQGGSLQGLGTQQKTCRDKGKRQCMHVWAFAFWK